MNMTKLTELLDEIKDLLVSLDTRLQRIEMKLNSPSDYILKPPKDFQVEINWGDDAS